MKKSIKIIGLAILMSGTMLGHVNGQFDEDRMQRDIRVASGILQTLTQDDGNFVMYGNNVTGEYIEGYGVMFSIGGGGGGYAFVAPRRVRRAGTAVGVGRSNEAVIWSEANSGTAPEVSEDREDVFEDERTDIKEVMSIFLADYSQLIGQLQPTDKIVLSTGKSDSYYYYKTETTELIMEPEAGSGTTGITAELLKKDHASYLAGKLKREQLIDKINFIELSEDNSRSKDLDLFASMLKTLYDVEYTDTYFISWTPEYQKIQGMGAIYSFKVFSSYDEDGFYRMPGINQKGLTEGERTENVVAMYPKFVQNFKENLIQYGRAIKSLNDDEMIMAKITMTKCDECNIPKKIQFTVKQSVLKDFNTGNLKLSEAVSKVKVSEL